MADKAVGAAGTLRITDTGSVVRFYVLCSNPQTFTGAYSYAITANGVTTNYTISLPAGFGSRLLAERTVTTSQRVTLLQRDTGTGGLGGQSSHYLDVVRATTPPAPSFLSLDNITTTGMRYRFQSNGTGGATFLRWEAQYSTSPTFASGNSPVMTSTGTTIVDNLLPGVRYYWRARGVNVRGNGPWGAAGNATTLHVTPGIPPSPVLSNIMPRSMDFTAGDPEYSGGTILERKVLAATNLGFTENKYSFSTASGTATNMKRDTRYYWKQRVRNAVGWSDWSAIFSAPTTWDPPAAPVPYAADIRSTSVAIMGGSLSDNGGRVPSKQRVRYGVGSTIFLHEAESPYWGKTILTGLNPGATIYYQVSAFNGSPHGDGWGAWSDTKTTTLVSNLPSEPLNLAVSSVTQTTALLTWDLPANLYGTTIQSQRVSVARDPSFSVGAQIMTVSATTTSQPLGGLLPNTVYYAQVYANSSNGPGSQSQILVFTTASGPIPASTPFWIVVDSIPRKVKSVWMKIPELGAYPNLFTPGVLHPSETATSTWKAVKPWLKVATEASSYPGGNSPDDSMYPGYSDGEWKDR